MSLLERNSTIFLDFINVEFITVAYNSDINKSEVPALSNDEHN